MAGAGFKDHFSSVADVYAQARPDYPAALFDTLAAHVPASAHVWEPGCGSGQATRGLAARFAHVHATDPSVQQIAHHWAAPHDPGVPAEATDAGAGPPAPAAPQVHAGVPGQAEAARVHLAVEPAERTVLHDRSVELVAVAQALHWFDHRAFFDECTRVLAPGGVLAAWGYGDFQAPAAIAGAAAAFSAQILPHWPPERALVDARYETLPWPFPPLPAPPLWLEADWTLPHFLAYLASISAAARCRSATGVDPVAAHAPAISAAWGDPAMPRRIAWPLFLQLRRKP